MGDFEQVSSHREKKSISIKSLFNYLNGTGFLLYPLKTLVNHDFLMFSGGIVKDQWYKMGLTFPKTLPELI